MKTFAAQDAPSSLTATGQQRVDVVLAVYNGAAFLPEFLESLEAQTHRNWRLVARDNHSTDGTPQLLDAWGAAHPGQYCLAVDEWGFFGRAAGNFNAALRFATAAYIMFADADDIWLPDKVERTLERMRAVETAAGPNRPILIHTDLEVVDSIGRTLSPSFWAYTHTAPTKARQTFPRLVVRNVITGCTVLINRPLLDRGWPVPDGAGWHDWWFGLVAAAFGEIEEVRAATVRYRQHGGNETGAGAWNIGYAWRRLRGGVAALQGSVRRAQAQAALFRDRFGHQLAPATRLWLDEFVGLARFGPVKRRWCAARCRVASIGWARTLGWYLFL